MSTSQIHMTYSNMNPKYERGQKGKTLATTLATKATVQHQLVFRIEKNLTFDLQEEFLASVKPQLFRTLTMLNNYVCHITLHR